MDRPAFLILTLALFFFVAPSCSDEIAGPPDTVVIFDESHDVVIRRCTQDIEDVEVVRWSEDDFPDDPSDFPESARVTPSIRKVDGSRVLVVSDLPSDSRSFVLVVRSLDTDWASYRIDFGSQRSGQGHVEDSGAEISRSSAEAQCRS